jgi:hypothetical protein
MPIPGNTIEGITALPVFKSPAFIAGFILVLQTDFLGNPFVV